MPHLPALSALIFCCIAIWVEVDLFVPSSPEMLDAFQATPEILQLTLSVNFLGFFLSALFAGPLADSYGRRKPLIIGSALFTLGSFFCFTAATMQELLIGRFIQGLGVGLPAVIMLAVLADLYSGEKQVEVMGYFNAITSATLSSAPIVGSYLNFYFGWHANFMAILLISFCATLTLVIWLPETLAKTAYKEFGIKNILQDYWYVLRHREGSFYNLGLATLIAAYIVFVANTPLFFVEELGISLAHFGFYQGAVVASFSIFSFCNGPLIKKFGSRFCLQLGGIICLLGSIALVICAALFPTSAWLITLSMVVCSAGMVFPASILYAQYMDLFPDHKGSAAGLFLGMRLLAQGLATAIAGFAYDGTFLLVGLVILVSTAITAWVSWKAALRLPTF